MSALRYIKKNAMAYLFLLPFVLLFTLFVILPVLYAIFLSLTNYNMLENPGFVGITNYKLLILDDDEFIIALKNTFVFSCISGPISFSPPSSWLGSSTR